MLTPCVKICVYNAQRGLCEGCGRTGAEIGNWLKLTDEQRRLIMVEAAKRLVKLT
jgi:predicted Fe-S protein YdhL (DUF1289 family)